MGYPFHRACAHAVRAFAFACAAIIASGAVALAHEGHDHGSETLATAGPPASPRVVATSESYQFVGIVEGEVLVIYLDRAADNSPVTTATIELTLDGEPTKVEQTRQTAPTRQPRRCSGSQAATRFWSSYPKVTRTTCSSALC